MDVLTQGALGAAMAACAARRGEVRVAALVGLVAGVIADADALIRSPHDPLLVLEAHRHFTHALLFAPAGALVASLALWPWLRRRLPARRLYGYAFLGYVLSGVLDACTSYGTSLLWPLSEARVAWSVVSIVDPVFTLLLAVPLAAGLARRRPGPVRAGLVLAALYLGAGAVQHERARDALERVADARGHRPERLLVKPTIGNLLLWRGLYLHEGVIHAEALRAGRTVRHYPGERVPLAVADGVDARRFARLSDGWTVADPRHPGRIGDARYAMLPTSLEPLWGIEEDAGGGLRFVVDRSLTEDGRARFLEMLLGG